MNDTRRRQGGDAPLTELEMRAAQLALMLTPAPRDAKSYGLPEDAIATAVAKHLSNKQGFEARIPWPPSLFPVEVRDSPFHGKGVFVTKDVECGQLLTLYPPDAFAFAQPAKGGREWFHVSPDIEHDVEELFEALHTYAFSLGTPGASMFTSWGFQGSATILRTWRTLRTTPWAMRVRRESISPGLPSGATPI